MADENKCKHPACNCVPPKGQKFCSEWCEDSGKLMELACQCGHSGCQGEELKS